MQDTLVDRQQQFGLKIDVITEPFLHHVRQAVEALGRGVARDVAQVLGQLGPVDVRVADAGQQQLPGDRGFQRQRHVHEPAHCGLVLFQIGELFQSIDGADVVAQGDPESMPQVFIVSRHSGQRFEQGAEVVEVRV